MTPKQFKETCTGLGMSKKQILVVLKAIKRKSNWSVSKIDTIFVPFEDEGNYIRLAHFTHNDLEQVDILEVRF